MNEKFRAILRKLNCATDRKFRAADIPVDLLVVNNDNEPTEVNLMKRELNICCLPANKTFTHLLYDVYRALATHSTMLNSYQGEAEKFIENNYSDMPMGLRLVASTNMAKDAYAVNKSGYMGPIDAVLPLKGMSDIQTFGNKEFRDKQLTDANKEIIIRRKYMKKFMDALKEKSAPKRKKKLSLKERKALFDNFASLAELSGYNTAPNFEDTLSELSLEERKKKVEESLLPMQFVCKRLHLAYTNKDTFETSCKRLIDVFDRENPDYNAFVWDEKKKKKEERIKDIDTIYFKMRPLVQNFLKPQYEIYSKEFSMIKRGPLRDMISQLMKENFMVKTFITDEEITNKMNWIKGIK